MKKLISILTTLTMLFTFAAIPAFAEGEDATVDFNSTANMAKDKTVTTIVAEGETAETITTLTDGDTATAYEATGAISFYVDFAANYQVNDITFSFGSESASVNVYSGNTVDTTNLIGTATNDAPTVNANGKIAQYITIESATAVTINEIYVDTQFLDGDWNIALKGSTANTYSTSGQGNVYYDAKKGVDTHTGIDSSVLRKVTNGVFIDGDADTSMQGNTYKTPNSSTNNNVIWTLTLDDYYVIDEITIYSSGYRDQANTATVYLGQTVNINSWSTISTDKRKVAISVPAVTEKTMVTNSKNLQGVSTYVSSVPAHKEVAKYITVVYGCYTGSCAEISVKGTKVTGERVDFRASDNLARSAKVSLFTGSMYSSNGTYNNVNEAVDGTIAAYDEGDRVGIGVVSATGKNYGGVSLTFDLGEYYKLSEVTEYSVYASSTTVNVFGDKVLTLDANKKYLNAVGAFATPISTIKEGSITSTTVNGIDSIFVYNHSFTEADAPVRYVTVQNNSWGTNIAEIVIKGTPVSKLEVANPLYSYDVDEDTVKANLVVVNGAETPSTAGKVFFAAYAGDTLVGTAIADAESLETGESATIAPAAFAVTAEPTTVKAYYWTDKLVPIFDSAIDLK